MARVGLWGNHVNLVLTEREAKALWKAAGELLDHPEALEAYHDGRDRQAAYRAHDALGRGWVLAERKRRDEE
jgi:hypothetical protein